MMTVVFAGLLLLGLWRGYVLGIIHSLARLLSWIVAYPAAYFLTLPVSNLFFNYTPFQGLMVYFIAGALVFIGVSVMATLLFTACIPYLEAEEKTTSSKVSGGMLGGFVGGFVGLLVAYSLPFISLSEEIENAKSMPTMSNEVSRQLADNNVMTRTNTLVDTASKKMVSTVANFAMQKQDAEPNAVAITQAVVENPVDMLGHVAALTQEGTLNQFFLNTAVQGLLDKGDVEGLVYSAAFKELMKNQHVKKVLSTSGEKNTDKAERFLATKIVGAWQKKERIMQDPQALAILADAEVQQQLAATHILPLLMNPKVKQLVGMFFEKSLSDYTLIKQAHSSVSNSADDVNTLSGHSVRHAENSKDEAPSTIYQWKDDSGVVHYSDQPRQQ